MITMTQSSKMRMTQTVLLPALVLALSFHGISSSTLEDLCFVVGDMYVGQNFCMATLSADPRSATADRRGLGVIATELAAAKAAVVKTKLEDLARKAEGDAVDKKRAEAFRSLYSNMIASLRWSKDSLASGFRAGPAAVLAVAELVPDSYAYVSADSENYVVRELLRLAHAIAVHLT